VQTRLGLVAPLMSGKTSVANILCRDHRAVRIALADQVKEDVVLMRNALMDWYVEHYPGVLPSDTIKPWDVAWVNANKPLVRWWLQGHGTDLMRNVESTPDHWLRVLEQKLEELPADAFVVVDDVRFPNEVEYLDNLGFAIARVHRPEKARKEDITRAYPDPKARRVLLSHASETHAKTVPVDFEIPNKGSLNDLRTYLSGSTFWRKLWNH
jgi:hypothetical protein